MRPQRHSCSSSQLSEVLRPPRGFTIIEALIVVSIIAILAALAGPSFTTMVADHRIKGAGAEVHATLVRARSEATQRNAVVTVRPVGGQWTNGWTIETPDPANAAQILTLDAHAQTSGIVIAGPASVAYDTSGRIQGNAAITFSFTSPSSQRPRCLSVDPSGRPKMNKDSQSC